jgi:hypothetical protein
MDFFYDGFYNATPAPPLAKPTAQVSEARQKDIQAKLEAYKQQSLTTNNVKPPQRYRAFRFIEYTGTMEWINDCIARRSVKGTKIVGSKGGVENAIREGMIGEGYEKLDTRPLPDFYPLRNKVAAIRSLEAQLIDFMRYGSISQGECAERLEKIAQGLSDAISVVENQCR